MKAVRIAVTLVASAGACLSAGSCKEPTSVEIEVRTTLRPSEVRGTQFFVGGEPFTVESDVVNGYPSAEMANAEESGFVGTLVSVPQNGESGVVSVVVVMGFLSAPSACRPSNGYKGCIVARRQLPYRAHERLRVPILLDPSCVDVPCDAVSTCARGSCFSSYITCGDDGTCRGPENGGQQLPPARPVDGGRDATTDGAPDASFDASNDVSFDGSGEAGSDAAKDGGGVTTTPDAIACPGTAACTLGTQTCCYAAVPGACVPNNVLCTLPTLNIRCDGPEDCAGDRCCIISSGTACFVGCPSEGARLCNTDADCSPTMPTCTANEYLGHYRACK